MDNIFMPEPHKILQIKKLTAIECLFRVEFEKAGEINFGQFFQISLPQAGECPISISDFSKEEKWAEFLIRKVGTVTDKIFALKVGDILPMRGPYGHGFELSAYAQKDLIIAAGGSGVAPVRSLINHIEKNKSCVKNLNLIFGFRDNDSILFEEDIKRWQTSFDVTVTLDKGSGKEGKKIGLVTDYAAELPLVQKPVPDLQVIIVGPPVMMKFTAQKFLALGAKEENIWVSFERKMSCAVGKCGHCRIDETYVCLEGPVFNYVKAKQLID